MTKDFDEIEDALTASQDKLVRRMRSRIERIERGYDGAAAVEQVELGEHVRQMLAFRLGSLFVELGRKPWKLLVLPFTIPMAIRDFRISKNRAQQGDGGNCNEDAFDRALFYPTNYPAFEAYCMRDIINGDDLKLQQIVVSGDAEEEKVSRFAARLSQTIVQRYPAASLALTEYSFSIRPSETSALLFSKRLFQQGHLQKSASIVEKWKLKAHHKDDEATMGQLDRFLDMADMFQNSIAVPVSQSRKQILNAGQSIKVGYLLNRSLATDAIGYTYRSQKILKKIAASDTGIEVYPVVSPTYDIETGHHEIDGIGYDHLNAGLLYRGRMSNVIYDMADALVAFCEEHNIQTLVAASNYRTGLVGLIAARKLGIPFVYDVRGFWYLTAASKREGWEATDQRALDEAMEFLVMREADHVLTISGTMRDYIAKHDIDPGKISLFPNACDPLPEKNLETVDAIRGEAAVASGKLITFIGSLTPYEGVDLIIEALYLLRDAGHDITLMIVGDGMEREALVKLAESLGLNESVKFTGRVDGDAVPQYMYASDLLLLPRKPIDVCRVVTPLKIFEYLQSGVPVLASPLPPLQEISDQGASIHFFDGASPRSLALETARILSGNTKTQGKSDYQPPTWQEAADAFTKVTTRLVSD